MNFEKSYGVLDPRRLAKWFKHDDGGNFLIAPMNNPSQIEENIKLINVKDSGKELSETLYDAKRTSCTILATSILMDWEDVYDKDDKKLAYSPKVGTEIIYGYDDFREWVLAHSSELYTSNKEKKDAIVKK